MAITETVTKWNSALHIRTINLLNDLYAPEVLINGEAKTRAACIIEKSNMVNQSPGRDQEIISPIQITFYQSGTVRSFFIGMVDIRRCTTMKLFANNDVLRIISPT